MDTHINKNEKSFVNRYFLNQHSKYEVPRNTSIITRNMQNSLGENRKALPCDNKTSISGMICTMHMMEN